ncbi:MAG: hypothetical protein WD552_01165 [Candidatus Paceibacterota bacterium]
MQWRTRRKLTYTLIALLPLLLVAGVVYVATFFPEPTCFDGEQSGDETGIDCGGSCALVCQAQTSAASVVWDRAFQVGGDVYSLAAYIENPNTDLVAEDVSYIFRLYDKDNIFITERRGSTTLLPQATNIVFIGGVDTNGRVPSRAVFSYEESPFWQQAEITGVDFAITNRSLTTGNNPRLSFAITNRNNQPFFNVELTGIVFTAGGEAVHISQTLIDRLDVEESTNVVFTWRESFSAADGPYRTEIIPTAYQIER